MNVRCFLRPSFLRLNKVNRLVKPNQVTCRVPGHHLGPDLIVPHPVQHDLQHHLVPEGVHGLAAGALQGHSTQFSSSSNPGSERPNGLVTLLRHPPHIHGVDGLVNLQHGQLLHGGQEQGCGGKGGVGAGVVDPL